MLLLLFFVDPLWNYAKFTDLPDASMILIPKDQINPTNLFVLTEILMLILENYIIIDSFLFKLN